MAKLGGNINMNEEQIKATAVKYEQFVSDLDNAIQILNEFKNEGKNVYINFNNQKLYSLLDDENSCYVKVLKMSKQDFEEEFKKESEKFKKKEEKGKQLAESKESEWIERGKKLIYPQVEKDWINLVQSCVHDSGYFLTLLDNVLDVMECLDNGGTIEKANQILESINHSASSYSSALNIIGCYSKRGPEFYRAVNKNMLPHQEQEIQEIEKENELFEKELASQENA